MEQLAEKSESLGLEIAALTEKISRLRNDPRSNVEQRRSQVC